MATRLVKEVGWFLAAITVTTLAFIKLKDIFVETLAWPSWTAYAVAVSPLLWFIFGYLFPRIRDARRQALLIKTSEHEVATPAPPKHQEYFVIGHTTKIVSCRISEPTEHITQSLSGYAKPTSASSFSADFRARERHPCSRRSLFQNYAKITHRLSF